MPFNLLSFDFKNIWLQCAWGNKKDLIDTPTIWTGISMYLYFNCIVFQFQSFKGDIIVSSSQSTTINFGQGVFFQHAYDATEEQMKWKGKL